jgi:DNA-binding CsgD family transcriptional regulator
MAFVQVFMGASSFMLNDLGDAEAHYGEALYIYRSLGDFSATIPTLCHLSLAQAALGDERSASASVEQALHTYRSLGDVWRLSIAIEAAVLVRASDLREEDRQRLLGSRDSLRAMNGFLNNAWLSVSRKYAGMIGKPMDGDTKASSYVEGRRLSSPEVIELAETLLERSGAGDQAPEAIPEEQPGIELSVRELEVIRLVAGGLSSKAIGQQIFISTSTVNYHLTSIFNKFGVDNRAHAVAVAASRGLL